MTTRVAGQHGAHSVDDEQLSSGGVGSIHRTSDPRWVYKRYFDREKAPAAADLARLVAIGREVLIAHRAVPGDTPESSINWPVDVVIGPSGAVLGVILPIIPARFFTEHGNVQGLEFLVMARAKPPPAKARVALLLRMAEILAFVNARGLVHGDINGKNLAWTLNPVPTMYLIDCDGMVPQSPPPSVGVQAVGWTDPRLLDRLVPAQDQFSDWYALGLAIYRGLLLTPGKLDKKSTDGAWPSPGSIPPQLDSTVAGLLRRALEPLRGKSRPAPDEWVTALRKAYLPAGRFNEPALADLDRLSEAALAKLERDRVKTPPRQDRFTDLPHADWASGSTRSSANARRPVQTPQPPLGPTLPPPGVTRPPPPPPPPPPRAPVQPPATTQAPPRKIRRPAASALAGGPRWYFRGLATAFLLPPLAVAYTLIAWLQLRPIAHWSRSIRRKKIIVSIYGLVALVWMFFWLEAVGTFGVTPATTQPATKPKTHAHAHSHPRAAKHS
jgi:hypothetical protein